MGPYPVTGFRHIVHQVGRIDGSFKGFLQFAKGRGIRFLGGFFHLIKDGFDLFYLGLLLFLPGLFHGFQAPGHGRFSVLYAPCVPGFCPFVQEFRIGKSLLELFYLLVKNALLALYNCLVDILEQSFQSFGFPFAGPYLGFQFFPGYLGKPPVIKYKFVILAYLRVLGKALEKVFQLGVPSLESVLVRFLGSFVHLRKDLVDLVGLLLQLRFFPCLDESRPFGKHLSEQRPCFTGAYLVIFGLLMDGLYFLFRQKHLIGTPVKLEGLLEPFFYLLETFGVTLPGLTVHEVEHSFHVRFHVLDLNQLGPSYLFDHPLVREFPFMRGNRLFAFNVGGFGTSHDKRETYGKKERILKGLHPVLRVTCGCTGPVNQCPDKVEFLKKGKKRINGKFSLLVHLDNVAF